MATDTPDRFPEEARPPSSREAEDRAEADIEARLEKHDIVLEGSESAQELIDMLNAVQRFDAARAAVGASSMTNAGDSTAPDDPAFVIPQRRADESPRAYADRVRDAADRLRG